MVIRVAEGAGYSIDHEGNGASASMISILTLFTQYLVPTFEILAFAIDIARDGGDANMNPRLFVVDRLPKLNEDFIDNTNHSYDAGRRATSDGNGQESPGLMVVYQNLWPGRI